jgi:hypothetical protein
MFGRRHSDHAHSDTGRFRGLCDPGCVGASGGDAAPALPRSERNCDLGGLGKARSRLGSHSESSAHERSHRPCRSRPRARRGHAAKRRSRRAPSRRTFCRGSESFMRRRQLRLLVLPECETKRPTLPTPATYSVDGMGEKSSGVMFTSTPAPEG